MKAFLFHKFNNIYKDNTLDYCFTILYRGTLGEKAIQTVSIIQSHGRVNGVAVNDPEVILRETLGMFTFWQRRFRKYFIKKTSEIGINFLL